MVGIRRESLGQSAYVACRSLTQSVRVLLTRVRRRAVCKLTPSVTLFVSCESYCLCEIPTDDSRQVLTAR